MGSLTACVGDREHAHHWMIQATRKMNIFVKGKCKFCKKTKTFKGTIKLEEVEEAQGEIN